MTNRKDDCAIFAILRCQQRPPSDCALKDLSAKRQIKALPSCEIAPHPHPEPQF